MKIKEKSRKVNLEKEEGFSTEAIKIIDFEKTKEDFCIAIDNDKIDQMISKFNFEKTKEYIVLRKENDQEIRELLRGDELKDKLLRSNEVKMSFDLMTKSYQEDRHPKSTYLNCLAFYNICSDNNSLDIISSYLREDPTIIPNKIKSFLIIFGKKNESNSEIPKEMYYCYDNVRKSYSHEIIGKMADKVYKLYNDLYSHFSSHNLHPKLLHDYSYDLTIESLSKRESLIAEVNNPNPYHNFFQRYGDLGPIFFRDTELRKILTEFEIPETKIQPSQTSQISQTRKLERDI